MSKVHRRHLLAGASLAAGGAALSLPSAANAAEPEAADRPAVIGPGDPRYPALTVGNNQRWSARPSEVVLVDGTSQVVRAVQTAVRRNRRISVRSGGHCYEDFVFHPDAETIIDLSLMNQVDFDPAREAFAVQPGASLLRIYETLYHRWGVTIPGGSCYSVGAGGHIVGGGYGFLSRRHGLTVDHLHAVEVVVVDQGGNARAVVASRDHTGTLNDLWWAHTGAGGGNFGVITRYWLRSANVSGAGPAGLLPQPPSTVFVHGLGLSWTELDRDRFGRLLDNYGRWHESNSTPGSPGTALSAILALNHRSAGGIGLVAQVDGTVAGGRDLLNSFFAEVLAGIGVQARALNAPAGEFGPLPSLAEPQTMPWWSAVKLLGTNSPVLTSPILRAKHKSGYLRHRLTTTQADAIYRHLTRDDYQNPNAMVIVFGYGGQINAVPPAATAAAQRSSVLKLLFQAFWANESGDPTGMGWVRDIYGDVYAQTGGVPVPDDVNDGCYINYPDTDLHDPQWNRSGVPWGTLYYKNNYARLQRAKATWDPLDIFRHSQSIKLPAIL